MLFVKVWQTLTNIYSAYVTYTHTHTHTHPFNGPLSGTTRLSRYQKGKTNLDFTEARNSEWQWNPLGHMQLCTSLQTDNHASTPPLSFLQTGCPSSRPTNSVKALKAYSAYVTCSSIIIIMRMARRCLHNVPPRMIWSWARHQPVNRPILAAGRRSDSTVHSHVVLVIGLPSGCFQSFSGPYVSSCSAVHMLSLLNAEKRHLARTKPFTG